jgi:hypothetical protein
MTQFDQLRLQMRGLVKRIAALEAAQTARPARHKRIAAPRPDDAIIAARERLWDRFVLLQVGHGPTTKLAFVVKHRLGDPSDFCRFFSGAGKRGIPEGSVPANRYCKALREAIAELEARRRSGVVNSLGNITSSPYSAARPQ